MPVDRWVALRRFVVGDLVRSRTTGVLSVMARYPVLDATTLLRSADEALYEAKGAGRNRVIAAG